MLNPTEQLILSLIVKGHADDKIATETGLELAYVRACQLSLTRKLAGKVQRA
jgi:hypothetical protein